MIRNYKTIIGALALTIASATATFAQCNELFISEIVFAKDNVSISGNSPIANSYALELFNPRDIAQNLAGYYIKLVKSDNTSVDINLSGSVNAKGRFTVGFAGSDVTLQQITDFLTPQLDLVEKTRVELWNANGIIDRIGEANLSAADQINIAAALADPVNYLNTINVDLTSLKNFTVRRKYSETSGDPLFISPADKWTVAANGDISNIGVFSNVCSELNPIGGGYRFDPISYSVTEGSSVTVHMKGEPCLDANNSAFSQYVFVVDNTDSPTQCTSCTPAPVGSYTRTGGSYVTFSASSGTEDITVVFTPTNNVTNTGTRCVCYALFEQTETCPLGTNIYCKITIHDDDPTGINDIELNSKINSFFDNSRSSVIVNFDDAAMLNSIYSITSLVGNIIKTGKLNNSVNEIPFAEFTSGFYLISIKTDNGMVTKKFLKN